MNHRFQIGEVECIALSDGTFNYPANWFFSNVPEEELSSKLDQEKLSREIVESNYTCLFLRTGKHRILIDTGADGLAPTTGNLLKNLEAAADCPGEITHVLLTHGHPDHIGGAGSMATGKRRLRMLNT